ncbi:MAG: hypothetical protein SAK29_36370 [Scytonema sp. PMC 1069.18]|nr:hypothetical protein [Scytonema sp. PMC 1069.18]MEC4888250.1 hypothetical protein [Scytonema sp. PMC 1070.18]
MRSRQNWLGLGLTVALMSATTAPVGAQSVIIINRGTSYEHSQPPAVGSFIYGSPIPTPVPVNPSTGLIPSRVYNTYPQRRYKGDYDRYPRQRYSVKDSTIVNPILVNPRVRNSTLVHPVIIKDSP